MPDRTFTALLTDTCTIKRRTFSTTQDRFGASIETLTTVATAVICRIQQREESIEFTRRGAKFLSRHLGFFEITTDLVLDDVIEWDGLSYMVVAVSDAAGCGHHIEASLTALEN